MNTERKQEEGDPRAGGQPQILPVLEKKELCPLLSPFLFNQSKTNTMSVLAETSIAFGEGNGTPLQCSCLENPRDGGAWRAAVYGVTQSRIRLK